MLWTGIAGRCNGAGMIQTLLSRDALTSAFEEARAGPYVSGAVETRPWLRLLGVVALTLVFAFVAVAALGLVMAFVFPGLLDPALFEGEIPDWTLAKENQLVTVLAACLMLLALCVLGAAMILYRRGFGAFLWPAQRGGGRLFLFGALVMAGVQLALWPLTLWLEPGGGPPMAGAPLADAATYVAVAGVGLLIAAAAEEIVFRGVLLRIVGGLARRAWVTCLVTGLLFSLIHWDPDPVAFVLRALSGVVWAWAALRLGGIAFAVGAHWINNLTIALLIEPISSAAQPGQDFPPAYILIELVVAVVFVIAVEWLARRRSASA